MQLWSPLWPQHPAEDTLPAAQVLAAPDADLGAKMELMTLNASSRLPRAALPQVHLCHSLYGIAQKPMQITVPYGGMIVLHAV